MGERITEQQRDKQTALQYLTNNPQEIVKAAARHDLLAFARYMQPSLDIQPCHAVYYRVLNEFAHGRIKKLIITCQPQLGKSEGSSRKLPAFLLGLNPDKKIVIGSYSTSFARDFNRDIQKIIDTPEYLELFPDTYLSRSNKVSATHVFQRNSDVIECVGHHGWLRAVGRGAPLTGKTVDVSILDDVYKDYAEANSPVVRHAAWKWYTTVIRTRLHNNSQELIVFTRWHTDDIIGRLERIEPIIDMKAWSDIDNIPDGAWLRINFEAIKTSEKTEIDPREIGEVLWPSRHSLKNLLARRKLDKVQFDCLYQGQPGSAVGRLLQPFKTYTDWHEYGTLISKGNYTDCADEGSDYLCSICYNKLVSRTATDETGKPVIFIAVTDVVYTDEPIEVTTSSVPMMLNREGTQYANIESNNGGRAFATIIEPKTRAKIFWFTQTKNKESRIITNAGLVNYHIIMPFDWETRFPLFYEHTTNFLRNFKANAHDDACFAAGTKVMTQYGEKSIEDIKVGDKVITPFGLRKVTACGMTGRKKIISKFGLKATENHKIFQEKRFNGLSVSMENLLSLYKLKELLLWRYQKLLLSMEKNTPLWGREDIICARQIQMRKGNVLKDCMWRFGNFIAERKCRKAIAFIIKTVIAITTTIVIWSVSSVGNTCRNTQRKISAIPNIGKRIKSIWKRFVGKLQNGTKAMQGENGIKNILYLLIGYQKSSANALIAEKNFCHAIKIPDFAVTDAGNDTDISSHYIQQYAKNAENHLYMEGKSIKKENFAAVHVQQDTGTCIVPVYNIKVEDVGCYYANGILVSNCDALTGIIEKEILDDAPGITRKN